MQSKEINSLQNPLVKHFVKLRTTRSYRHREQQVVIAGKKEIAEANNVHILITKKSEKLNVKADETYFVNDAILKKITGFENPEPTAAIVSMPKPVALNQKKWILALDRVSDPGNMGTLLRTALALGWEGIFLTSSCVDPFNDKAMRAARGAIFHLPYYLGTEKELIELGNTRNTLVATLSGTPLTQIERKPTLLILGNEANGPSETITKTFPGICIPITSIESLNVAVAGGILLYGLKS